MKSSTSIIFLCCFTFLAFVCLVSASRDTFDILGDYLELSDALRGGSGGGGGGRGGGSGGRGGGNGGGRGGRGGSNNSGGRSSPSSSGRSPTTGRQSGYNRPGRVSGPGRSPTSMAQARAQQINSRISAAFSAVSAPAATSKLTAQALRSYVARNYAQVNPNMLSAKPMGPLSTFSKVNPSLPTNTFTKPAAQPVKNVPVPMARPENIPTTPTTVKQTTFTAAPSKRAQDVVAAFEKNVLAGAKPNPTGYCARHVANAIDAALGTKVTRPNSAKDFGSYLEANGFKQVTGPMKPGDVQVFQGGFTDKKGKTYTDGHMQMKTTTGFVSDFKQTDMYAGPGYRAEQQQPTNYRYGG